MPAPSPLILALGDSLIDRIRGLDITAYAERVWGA